MAPWLDDLAKATEKTVQETTDDAKKVLERFLFGDPDD